MLAKVAAVALMAGVAGVLASQTAHADDTLLGPLAGSDTAIILGGTTEPTPSTDFAQAAENLYLHALGFDGGATSSMVCDMIATDPCSAPLQVLTTPELIQQGPSSLTAADDVVLAVRNEFDANPGAFDAEHPLTIFGYSQSATAESIAMTRLAADGIPKEDLHFVFIGDPSLAETGIWPNLVTDMDGIFGASLTNTLLNDLGMTGVLGNVTPDDVYPTTIYTLDGDGVADFQQDFNAGGLLDPLWNLFTTHVEYLGLTPTEIADATISTDHLITNVDIPNNFNDRRRVAERGIRARGRQQWTARERVELLGAVLDQLVLVVDLVADVTDDVAQHDPPVGEVIGGADNRQVSGGDRCGDGRRTLDQLRAGLDHVAGLELIRSSEAFTAAQQNRRRHPLDQIAHIAAGQHTVVQRGQRRLDRAAAVVAEDHDHRHAQRADCEFQ